MNPTDRLQRLARSLETELTQRILPYWYQTMDRRKGGFFGRVGNDNRVTARAPKGVVMHARHLWTSSAAWTEFHNPLDRQAADHAFEFLTGPLHDEAQGGFWWTVDDRGHPALDNKVLYGQAFAVYGLAQYGRSTGHRGALELALETFRRWEAVGRDRDHGGYFEAVDRTWSRPVVQALSDVDIPCAKSMNTNLHVLEALTALWLATGAPEVKAALADLVDVFVDHILVTPGHLGLYFDRDWTNLTDHLSYGHDIEASWLLCEASSVLEGSLDGRPSARVAEVARTIAAHTLEVLRVHGAGLVSESHGGRLDTDRIWWVQAEALVGLVNAWELTRDDSYLEAAEAVWDWVDRFQADRRHGEWFWKVDARGTPDPDQPKGGLWKTNYHNGRACLEVMHRARRAASLHIVNI